MLKNSILVPDLCYEMYTFCLEGGIFISPPLPISHGQMKSLILMAHTVVQFSVAMTAKSQDGLMMVLL